MLSNGWMRGVNPRCDRVDGSVLIKGELHSYESVLPILVYSDIVI